MCNLKLIGITGIQAAVVMEDKQTTQQRGFMIRVKNKPPKVVLGLPSSANLRYKFK